MMWRNKAAGYIKHIFLLVTICSVFVYACKFLVWNKWNVFHLQYYRPSHTRPECEDTSITTSDLQYNRLARATLECEEIDGTRSDTLPTNDTCAGYKAVTTVPRQVTLDILCNSGATTPGEDSITLVTQLSENRIDRLFISLQYWTGPVSAAVYTNCSRYQSVLASLRSDHRAAGRNNLQIHLVQAREEVKYYPFNFLRNVALNASRSRYVLLVDVDFIPSTDCHDGALKHLIHVDSSIKQVFVAPAFAENSNTSLNVSIRFPTKSEILKHWDDEKVQPFQENSGHRATEFVTWRNATKVYKISWEKHFEPYVFAHRSHLPAYDQHFIGRHMDKISYFYELHRKGFVFRVLPDVFLLHLWHPRAQTQTDVLRCGNDAMRRMETRLSNHSASSSSSSSSCSGLSPLHCSNHCLLKLAPFWLLICCNLVYMKLPSS